MERADLRERKKERAYLVLLRKQWLQRFVYCHRRQTDGRLEKLLWGVAGRMPFSGQLIPPLGSDPYLLRVYLTPDGARLHLPNRLKRAEDYGVGQGARPYLHFFFRSDGDREFHNHPWRISYSMVLTEGYTDHRWDPVGKKVISRRLYPGDINIIRHDDYHWVELFNQEAGCWTLFISVDRLQPSNGKDWGFLNVETGQYTPWGEYTQRRDGGPGDAVQGPE